MKALMRGFGLATMMALVLVLSGCAADNESEAEKAQKALGPAPTPEGKTTGQVTPPPKSQSELRPPNMDTYKKAMGRK